MKECEMNTLLPYFIYFKTKSLQESSKKTVFLTKLIFSQTILNRTILQLLGYNNCKFRE